MTLPPGEIVDVAGTPLEVRTCGSGPPLVFLHGGDGLLWSEAAISALAEHFSLTVPSHPGWGRTPMADQFRRPDDLAYLYLDLLETFAQPVALLGVSFGAWVAAEIVTKSCEAVSHLVLVAPLGLRSTSKPTERSYLDIYASSHAEVHRASYGPVEPSRSITDLSDGELLSLAQAQDALAHFGWEPYLHTPGLQTRLHRVKVPTLVVGGEHDGLILATDHLQAFAEGVAGPSKVVVVPDAGHRVEEQAPQYLGELVTRHVGEHPLSSTTD